MNLTKEEKREKRKEFSNRIKIDEAPTEESESFAHEYETIKPKIQTNVTITLNDLPVEQRPTIETNNVEQQLLPDRTYSIGSNRNFSIAEQFRARKHSTNSFNREKELLSEASRALEEYAAADKGRGPSKEKDHFYCRCDEEREQYQKQQLAIKEENDSKVENYTLLQKILIFFDLDLLKDLTYVNLMVGVTIAGFAELNYSVLTPFVLADYQFTKPEIAMVMSVLATMDISVRFFVPFVAGKIGWENNTFFLVGILGMALGRICKCPTIVLGFV